MPSFKSLIVAALLSCASATGLADGPASPVAVPPHRVIPVPPPPDAAAEPPTPSQPCFQTVVRPTERHAGKAPKHPKKQRSAINKAPEKTPDMPPCQP